MSARQIRIYTGTRKKALKRLEIGYSHKKVKRAKNNQSLVKRKKVVVYGGCHGKYYISEGHVFRL